MIGRELLRFLKNKFFILSCIGLTVSAIIEFFPSFYITVYNDGGLISELYYMARSDSLFRMTATLFTVLPCSCLVSEEIASGYYRSYLFRMGAKRYIFSRVSSAILCSIVACVITSVIFLSLYIFIHPNYIYLGNYAGYGHYFEDASFLTRFLFLLSRIFFIGFYCSAWSCVSLAAAAWSNNRYIILGIGFCIENLLQMLAERSIIPFILMPFSKMTGYGFLNNYPIWQQSAALFLYDAVIILTAVHIFAIGIKRRMSYA